MIIKYTASVKLNIQIENLYSYSDFEDIALEIGIAESTLRSFLNKNGYKFII